MILLVWRCFGEIPLFGMIQYFLYIAGQQLGIEAYLISHLLPYHKMSSSSVFDNIPMETGYPPDCRCQLAFFFGSRELQFWSF